MKFNRILIKGIGFIYFICFVYLSFHHFELEKITYTLISFVTNPFLLLLTAVFYATSFLLRAYSWKLYLKDKASMQIYLNGLWYSLFINHLVPIKVGDLVRIGFLKTKRPDLELEEITHSVVVMRIFDLLTVLVFSGMGLITMTKSLAIDLPILWVTLLSIVCFLAVFVVFKYKPERVMKHVKMFTNALTRRYLFIIVLAIILSWVLEASVVYFITHVTQQQVSFIQSVWVNSMTIGGQVFQFLPGGIATYETTMAFTLTQLKFSWDEAYQIALISHIFKFVFSYIMGAYVLLKDPISLKQIRSWLSKKEVKTD
ncbi:MAG: lysylphosphatidylglycerol synthase transmembrane domain-containing protein [Bacillota bacterium]